MELNKFISLLFMGCLVSLGISAKEFPVVVKLHTIKAERTLNAKGDDLYFEVTQFPTEGEPGDSRIPLYPLHWLSNQLDEVKDLVLWTGVIKEGESTKLTLSLVDQEIPPWEPDDLIGGAQLILKNAKGELNKAWSVPPFAKAKEVELINGTYPQRFVFKGDGSLYDVSFSVGHQ